MLDKCNTISCVNYTEKGCKKKLGNFFACGNNYVAGYNEVTLKGKAKRIIKYYFENEDSEICYNHKYWMDFLKNNDQGIKEIKLFEAVKEKDSEFFFCREVQECGDKGNCGKNCETYSPRNGESGICKNYSSTYTQGKKIILKLRK